MNAIQPAAILLANYFRPVNVCHVCRKADARTACGSSYCVTCWESINDELIDQAAEQEIF